MANAYIPYLYVDNLSMGRDTMMKLTMLLNIDDLFKLKTLIGVIHDFISA